MCASVNQSKVKFVHDTALQWAGHVDQACTGSLEENVSEEALSLNTILNLDVLWENGS